MKENGNTVTLTDEEGISTDFEILERAVVAGSEYLLVVSDDDGDEAQALMLKCVREDENDGTDDMIYETVEDENELKILSKYFEELLEDVEIRM